MTQRPAQLGAICCEDSAPPMIFSFHKYRQPTGASDAGALTSIEIAHEFLDRHAGRWPRTFEELLENVSEITVFKSFGQFDVRPAPLANLIGDQPRYSGDSANTISASLCHILHIELCGPSAPPTLVREAPTRQVTVA